MIYPVRRMPLELPRKLLLDTWDRPHAAFVYSLGTPMQKLIIDTACWLFRAGKIDRVLIVCGSVSRREWNEAWQDVADDIPISIGNGWGKVPLEPGINSPETLQFFCAIQDQVDASMAATMENFLYAGRDRTMIVIDNANFYNNPMSEDSLRMAALTSRATYRRVLMGALSRHPLGNWAVYRLLSGDGPHVLGYPSPAAMRARYYRDQKWIDQELLMQRIVAAPTFFMDKNDIHEISRIEINDFALGTFCLGEILEDLPGKVVVFSHEDEGVREERARSINRILWAQDNEHPDRIAIVGRAFGHVGSYNPSRRSFFQDPEVEVLLAHAHDKYGRLDCAHAVIYSGNGCGEHTKEVADCDKECVKQVRWNENRHKLTEIYIS